VQFVSVEEVGVVQESRKYTILVRPTFDYFWMQHVLRLLSIKLSRAFVTHKILCEQTN
jgi:hypothetical protein